MAAFTFRPTLIEIATAVLLLVLVLSFIPFPEAYFETEHPSGGGWRPSDVVDRKLVEDAGNRRTHWRYLSNGLLLVTNIDVEGGIEAPAMYWSIDSDGYLRHSLSPEEGTGIRSRLVSRNKNGIIVIREGMKRSLQYAHYSGDWGPVSWAR